LKPWLKESWCLPTVSAEFVWRREAILDLSAEPDDRHSPRVCCDEQLYPLVSEGRQALPVGPGQPRRYDDDYRREGAWHLWMCVAASQGWRHVKVTTRRTAQDFALCMKDLVDVHVPEATVVSVVLDHLNTQTPAALDATFPPAEACRILRQWDFH
jgi:hypothetical protein